MSIPDQLVGSRDFMPFDHQGWMTLSVGVVGFLLFLQAAYADGKLFWGTRRAPEQPVAAVTVDTPSQRAMLHYAGGVESLVIETAFQGQGSDFAWVVPLPSPPKIETVSTNFFPRLGATFQPRVVHPGSRWWRGFLVLGVLTGLGLWEYRTRGKVHGVILFALGVFLGAYSELPQLGLSIGRAKQESLSEATAAVEVLERQTVGLYELVTLAGTSADPVVTWLNTNGFWTPPRAVPVLDDYARSGWVFVAGKLNNSVAGRVRQPQPLAFAFRTPTPVYPLRLTGVENGPCRIELFVFGEHRAQVSGFNVEYCGPVLFPRAPQDGPAPLEEAELDLPKPGMYRVRNPEVCRWTEPASVVTKLVANLSSRQMRSDALVRWVQPTPTALTLYSLTAAENLALNWFLGVGVVGTLGLGIIRVLAQGRSGPIAAGASAAIVNRSSFLRRGLGWLWQSAAVSAVLAFFIVNKTEIQAIRPSFFMTQAFRGIPVAVDCVVAERGAERLAGKVNGPLAFEDVRAKFDEYHHDLSALRLSGYPFRALNPESLRNIFTGQRIRNEPTPGNITLRQTQFGVDVLWYDIDGVPCVIRSLKSQRAPG